VVEICGGELINNDNEGLGLKIKTNELKEELKI
jgi:hypothetical protein